MTSTGVISIRDEATEGAIEFVSARNIATNDRALLNDGRAFEVPSDAVDVAANKFVVVSNSLLGEIREQRLWNIRNDRLQNVPALPDELVSHKNFLDALELIEYNDKSEVFLRAMTKVSLDGTGKSASHDRVHLWPLALSTLVKIKSNIFNHGRYPRDRSHDRLRDYFSNSTIPEDEIKGVAQLRKAEEKPNWRLGKIDAESDDGYVESKKFSGLQEKSLAYTKAQKRKHALEEQMEQVAAVGGELEEYKKHVRKVYETPHGKDYVLEGDFDLGSVSFLPIKNGDGSVSLLVRTMKSA